MPLKTWVFSWIAVRTLISHMPPIQQCHCENIRSWRCSQFSNATVRTSGLANAPNSAMPLWECQVSQMPPIQQYHCENVRSWRYPQIQQCHCENVRSWRCPPIQQCHCENVRSCRCPQFSNATVRTSGLTDANHSAIPLWKGEISQMPAQFQHVSHVDMFQIVAQTAWWQVVTCSLCNFRPLLNSILKPEQTFSGMATGQLHNMLFVGDLFSVDMNFLYFSNGWCGCVLCGTNLLPSNVHTPVDYHVCSSVLHLFS
jgi:hypothetical protein